MYCTSYFSIISYLTIVKLLYQFEDVHNVKRTNVYIGCLWLFDDYTVLVQYILFYLNVEKSTENNQ